MSETHDLHWHRRNNPKLIARNMAYGILLKHHEVFQDDTPLEDLVDDIAAAILAGAKPEDEADDAD